MHIPLSLSLLSLSLAAASGAWAAPFTLDDAEAAKKAERVEVWGTRVKSSTQNIDDSQIELKQADHLSDLLRDLPGVDVGGTHSTNQRINIRGLDDLNLDIRIDGARQDGYMFHHAGNLLFNADILKAVDIDVGAQSVVYGGLGGSVRFVTKDAADLLDGERKFGGRVYVGYASNDGDSRSLTAYGQIGERLDVLAYGHRIERGAPEDGEGRPSRGQRGTTDNLLAKTGLTLAEGHRLTFSTDRYNDEGLYYPRADMGASTNDAISNTLLLPTRFDRDTDTLNYSGQLSTTRIKANIYENQIELERNWSGEITLGNSENRGTGLLLQTPLRTSSAVHQFTYGVEQNRQFSLNTNRFTTKPDISRSEEQVKSQALFIEDRIGFGNTDLIPGLRRESFERRNNSGEGDWQTTSKALRIEQKLGQHFVVHIGHIDTFRGPQLGEIFLSIWSAPKVANPNLRPETGYNREIGLRFQEGDTDQGLFNASLVVFQTRIDDKIESVLYTGAGAPPNAEWDVNLGAVELDGFETSLIYRLGDLRLGASFARSDSEVTATRQPLEREVGDSATLSATWTYAPADLDLSWALQWVDDESKVPASMQTKEGYQVHRIAAHWRPQNRFQGLSLSLGVENLFNETYASHASRTGTTVHPRFGKLLLTDFEPGRNINLTAAYRF